jgi:hypothetical protein
MPRGIPYTYTGPEPRDFPGSAAGEPTR